MWRKIGRGYSKQHLFVPVRLLEKDKTKVLSFQGALKKRMIYDIVEF